MLDLYECAADCKHCVTQPKGVESSVYCEPR